MMRLAPVRGEWIDRSARIAFSFEGTTYQAYRGDTISSALAANGVRVLGRSFKYHRPRGLLSFANHDVNAMVQIAGRTHSTPNVRADVTVVEAGWHITAVNTHGGVARDRLSVLDRLSRFLPVGFYYKAFFGNRLFPFWERMFRRLTGLGTVDMTAPHRSTPKRYDFCDVVIVGAGPAGLAAALAAARSGANVLIVDENRRAGGSGSYACTRGTDGSTRIDAMVSAVCADPRIRFMPDACAAGYYADHWIPLVIAGAIVKVRARAVVLAQGAYEQPAVFRGNDLPGVMLASAAQRLLYRFAVASARKVVLLTANAEGYAAAADARTFGIEVVAVLDLRAEPGPQSRALAEKLTASGVAVSAAVTPIEAFAGPDGCVSRLSYEVRGKKSAVDIDGLWMSVGFAPASELLHQAGGTVRYETAIEQFVPDVLPHGIYTCGKLNGVYGFDERLDDGNRAGIEAAAGLASSQSATRQIMSYVSECPNHAYPVFAHPKGKEFVDFDEDLQIRDIENACQEGFDSSELLKRFATVGMGPSQGKHSNLNALRILAHIRGDSLAQHSLTTARPMFHPVPMSHLAGRGFQPERRSPLDADHDALGAVWMPAANWRRPEYYAVRGVSREAAIAAEVQTVRQGVGLIDVGTLGKIEVHGPRAGEFLDRVYTGKYSSLKQGMTRYGLMLDEAGIVVDDGVIGRIGPESYYFTTTTGNSATLFREFGRLSAWWDIPVGLVNLTGHFAAFNLAGPLSRTVLCSLTELDLSDAAFPYLGVRSGLVAGVPCRLMRVGFVGELGYELHLPAGYGAELWRALLVAGRAHEIRPFGVEAQRMLRLEKGHIIVGQDTDGVTNALEIDAPWALKMDKPFFVGQRSLAVLTKQSLRQTLVGFRLAAGAKHRPRECHLFIRGGDIAGRVTSVGVSPSLGHVIGLALVDPTIVAEGKCSVRIDEGEEVVAELVKIPFYDPSGERQRLGELA